MVETKGSLKDMFPQIFSFREVRLAEEAQVLSCQGYAERFLLELRFIAARHFTEEEKELLRTDLEAGFGGSIHVQITQAPNLLETPGEEEEPWPAVPEETLYERIPFEEESAAASAAPAPQEEKESATVPDTPAPQEEEPLIEEQPDTDTPPGDEAVSAQKAEKPKKPHNRVLCGKPISGRETALDACDEEKRGIVIRGILSAFDWRAVRGDKALLTFTLTNYVSEVHCKAFVVLKTFQTKMEKELVKGATLLVKGNVEMDTYVQDLVFMANAITLCGSPLYVDPERKAELDKMIVGKPIKRDSVISIKRALQSENMGPVVIEGDILESETKDIRSGRTLLTLQMTDYTSSITVKAFVNGEVMETRAGDLKNGRQLLIKGTVEEDDFTHELTLTANSIAPHKINLKPERAETAPRRRVELHAHTTISEMDAVVSPKDLVSQAYRWGSPAVAVTDHGVVQGFPDAMDACKAIRKEGGDFKVIYGMEAYLVDDLKTAVRHGEGQGFDTRFTVFDLETTGFNKEKDSIIEIGAVRIENGRVTDRFSSFVNPGYPIPARITELTSITDADVADAPAVDEALPAFLQWAEGSVIVGHNVGFDLGFVSCKARELGLSLPESTVVDTLELAHGLLDLKKYTLDSVCKALDISLENHHRAVDDADATGQILLKCLQKLTEAQLTDLSSVNEYIRANTDVKRLKAYHAVILVRNLTGLRNLYELVSLAHLNYFYRTPRVPKSEFLAHREGLIISSGCEAGEVFQAVLHEDGEDVLADLMDFYDYLEIQPIGNNAFYIADKDEPAVSCEEDLRNLNRRIVALGERYGKPVVATGDVHFRNPEDALFREIIQTVKGFSDADRQAPLYFHTTAEMLEEFAYLGPEKCEEVVIDNTIAIADRIEYLLPIPDGQFAPVIEGAEEELENAVYTKAKSMYGDPLPQIVSARLERELTSIIKNGFATLYVLARRLVLHSVADGYYVGSRGSVGSSLVATMADITEVNPLPAHYYCPKCHYSDFDSEEVRRLDGQSGFDLPDAFCPVCGAKLKKDGQEIPFEVFLGFDGDKEPDIDLNFSGEYQPCAHAYVEEMFGKSQVYRAGTMSSLADKTAYGYVLKYLELKGLHATNARKAFLVNGITGVKRTTGQHPGGQLVVPKGYSIHQFCPVQHPANDTATDIITSHFDYNQLHGRLLKLDILGHDDPTMVRMLEDLTGFKATNAPIDDPEVMSLFLSTEALGVTPDDIDSQVGTFGVPEFGTAFVRGMLVETKPQNFSDLVRISGLSHGTDVWNNNAKDLVDAGTVKISQCICTREDIMNGLIRRGMEKLHAFKIMEIVRKGKKSGGLKDADKEAMIALGVEDWYIESCKKIQYLFPKAHAVAYVTMSLRVAYYKVHFKEAYYASYFTIRADAFDVSLMGRGLERARQAMRDIESKSRDDKTQKDKEKLTILQLVVEFYCRGLEFLPIDLNESDSRKFRIIDGKLLPPFNSIAGMGLTAAESIVEARKDGPFLTVADFLARTKVSRTLVDTMKELGALGDLPETDQLDLFSQL